jgi:hypothetical protein
MSKDAYCVLMDTCFPLIVRYNKCLANVLHGPRRRKPAFCHGVLSHSYANDDATWALGTTLCTVGFLIACIICAAAMTFKPENVKPRVQGYGKRRAKS